MRRSAVIVFAFLILLSSLSGSCSKKESSIVAKVGRDKITWSEFREEYLKSPQYRRAQDDSSAKREFLDTIIEKKLITQEAYKQGFDTQEEVVQQVERTEKGLILQSLYFKEIVNSVVTESEMREFYKHADKEVKARHILVKAPPNASPEDRGKARAKIDSLLVLIKDKGHNFAIVAKEHSEDPMTARNNGDLGFFGWGVMADEFQKVAFALPPGKISDVVETEFGYHIIQVEEYREVERKSYDDMKDMIRNKMMGRKKQELRQRTDEYVANLKNEKNLSFEDQGIALLSQKKQAADFTAEKLTGTEKASVLARYEGGEFTVSDYVDWEAQIPAKARSTATDVPSLKRHIEGKLVNDFLVEKAKDLNLHNDPDIKEKIRTQKEQIMITQFKNSIEENVHITEENLRTHFEQHRDKYVVPEKVNIREILVKEKTVAENLLKRMKGGADIASLAKQYSERKWAAERGGEFGFFTENQYGPIGKEAFALEVGEYGGPLSVSGGYSIFKVIDRQKSHAQDFDEVKSILQSELEKDRKKVAYEEVVASLKEKIPVEINLDILTMSVTEEQPLTDEHS